MIGALAVVLAAGYVTYQDGRWESFEHRLEVALDPDIGCRTSTQKAGFNDPSYRRLNAAARQRFVAFCDGTGPGVAWLRFDNAEVMHRALDRTDVDGDVVCISDRRAELLVWTPFDATDERLEALCHDRDGSVRR